MSRWPAALVAVVALSFVPASSSASFGACWSPIWSPNGRQIAFVSTHANDVGIYVMNRDGSGLREVTSDNHGADHLAWSPNGKWIAYDTADGISEVSVDGTIRRALVKAAGEPAFSPSGRLIAYLNGSAEFYSSIYVMRPDGTKKIPAALPRANETLLEPTWSPDGQKLAFSVGTAADSELITPYVAVISQYRGRRTVYARGHLAISTDWSPDGRKILLVQSARHGNGYGDWRISVLDLRTRKLHNLGEHAHLSAHWSPDGRRILFGDAGRLYVMNADGSHVRDVTPA